MGWDWGWRPYISVAERQYKAEKEIARMKKKGKVQADLWENIVAAHKQNR